MKTIGWIAGMGVLVTLGVIITNTIINTVAAVAAPKTNGSA
jgi:hypothetical protein